MLRDNKRVCNECADDNLCKTKWRPNGHFCGNRYQLPGPTSDNGGPANEVGITIAFNIGDSYPQ